MREIDPQTTERIQDVQVGDVFYCPRREEKGTVLKVTKRTIEVKFSKSTAKNTYYTSKCLYPLLEF